MNAKEAIVRELLRFTREEGSWSCCSGFDWEDRVFLRTSIIRLQVGDHTAWDEFLNRLRNDDALARGTLEQMRQCGFFESPKAKHRWLADDVPGRSWVLPEDEKSALEQILLRAEDYPQPAVQRPVRRRTSRSRIMYIEEKPGLAGHARIGRVTFSKSRATIYYHDRRLRSLEGRGYKTNYVNVDSGLEYWISGCRADGRDTLYPGIVHVDKDVQDEYWCDIRKLPERAGTISFRSPGKYAKRTPR